MKLIVVSGLSGSGKSIALETLEDSGYYCIDNLPVTLLEAFVKEAVSDDQSAYEKAAVSIDSRNKINSLNEFQNTLELVETLGIECEILFLQADNETLIKRFSETRRKHPLTDRDHTLNEAIKLERELLVNVSKHAGVLIDTTRTNIHQLRELVRVRVGVKRHQSLSLFFQSFGFKHGIPMDADFVFDARCLPNPHWQPSLRSLTGQDQAVVDFLVEALEVDEYMDDVDTYLHRWIPRFEAENRSYLTIAVGCTGGQHRSVYLVENLARKFSPSSYNILVGHRELA